MMTLESLEDQTEGESSLIHKGSSKGLNWVLLKKTDLGQEMEESLHSP